MKPGTLYIIAAPSGTGKTSLVSALIKQLEKIQVSISHTTRPCRSEEHDGVNYHFIDETQFQKMIADQVFLEYATVFSYHYGTSKDWVQKTLNQGIDVILVIDWQGAEQIKQLFPKSVSIFILPPSLATLKQRLYDRGQDKPDVIAERLAEAHAEVQHCSSFDYRIINDDFAVCLEELIAIIQGIRQQQPIAAHDYQKLIKELLAG